MASDEIAAAVGHDSENPLSFSQERLWFLNQLAPSATAYTISPAYLLTGPYDVAAFQTAFSDVVSRHDSLRSRIITRDGIPSVVVSARPSEPIPITNLTELPEQDRMAAAIRLASGIATRPFDLAEPPLYRCHILRLAPDKHLFLLTIHHVICDGWSLAVLWRELSAGYAARLTGESAELPELSIQYSDYARRQREQLSNPELVARELAYWREKLADPPPLALPTDRSRPETGSFRGARVPFRLPRGLTEDVRRLSMRERVTPFMTLLAAYQLLLARWAGHEDIIIGAPVAGRTRTDVEPLIGFFANTLVLRTDLSGNPTFRQLLSRVRDVVFDALEHQALPFDKIVAELQPTRNLGLHPFFQVELAVEDYPAVPVLAGLTIERVRLPRDSAQFDLTLSLSASDDGMTGEIEYATELFDSETVSGLRDQFERLLVDVVAHPDRRLSDAMLLTDRARAQAISDSTGPPIARPSASLLHAMAGAQATRSPRATAIIHGDQRISYAELDAQATGLAEELRGYGVHAEVPVGLYGVHTPDLVLGVLAILKAGGACVPLSPRLPPTRIDAILRRAGIDVVLCTDEDADTLPDNGRTITLPISRDLRPSGTLASDVTGDSLAFLLSTSGSSGTPKLVALTHSGLADFVTAMVESYGLSCAERVLGYWPPSSDGYIQQVFLALASGATLVISDDELETAARLCQRCERSGVTAVMMPTAYWHELVDGLRDQKVALPGTVRLVTFGGERASATRLRDWLARYGDRIRLVNEYGPSEATIFTTTQDLSGIPVGAVPAEVPIGRPIAGAGAYLLDATLRPVPPGVVGELYLAGSGVARGYHADPVETATRFLPDPVTTKPGQRVYRTGDLARWRNDGSLEYLGRADQQVKIRGFRVEPADVETTLTQHSGLAGAAVNAVTDPAGNQRLVGYPVVASGAPPPSADELRAFLAQRLPDYMIPSDFVVIDHLPMTPTGKVDRRALPAPPEHRPPTSPGHVGARNPVEEHLATLWRQILQLERVGMYDSFFELGGHSLQAVQLAARITTTLSIDIPVTLILQHPTISELAEELMALRPGLDPASEDPRHTVPPPAEGTHSPFRRFEARPLLTLLDAGEIPPVDAAALSCIPDRILRARGLSADQYISDWCQGVPILSGVKETPVGRIGLVMLPYLEADVYRDAETVVRAAIPGLKVAHSAGAQVVSLINLLSSATGHGATLADAVSGMSGVPRITTGHAVTTAAMVLNLRNVLGLLDRDITREQMAVLGLGSIGHSVLRLLLASEPHPERLLLCDLYSRREHLESIQAEVHDNLGFAGTTDILLANEGSVPDGLYSASIILAATNVPNTLDVSRLRPGCVVLDDSVPHCFDADAARKRFSEAGDVICTEGGELHGSTTMTELRYVPRWASTDADPATVDGWFEQDPRRYGGCVLAAALATRFADVPVTIGVPRLSVSRQALDLLPRLGFGPVPPQCDQIEFTASEISGFGRRFGPANGG